MKDCDPIIHHNTQRCAIKLLHLKADDVIHSRVIQGLRVPFLTVGSFPLLRDQILRNTSI